MAELLIESLNLVNIAINYFNCPTELYSLESIAGELSRRSNLIIDESDVAEFRTKYLSGNVTALTPLVDTNIQMNNPQSLEDLTSFAMVDTLSIRTGIMHQTFDIFRDAKEEHDRKGALSALDLLNKTSESLDKKMKQLSPNSDPASIVLGMKEFQKLKTGLNIVAERNPTWNMMEELKTVMEEQSIKDAEYTEV